MARFRAVREDLDELIRHHRWALVRRNGQWPLGALALSVSLVFVHEQAALLALGMSLAWSISTVVILYRFEAACHSRHAWMQEDAVIDIEEEGLRLSNARGSGFIRWDSGAIVRCYATCFVIDDEGEEIAIIPKRYLSTTEMLLLQKRAAA